MTAADLTRLQRRLIAGSTVDPESGCWIWNRKLNRAEGYPVLTDRRNGKHVTLYAHRVAFEEFRGPIPAGLHIDHMCQQPRCICPDHLRAVEPAENSRLRWTRNR
jgi:hypothetical protein